MADEGLYRYPSAGFALKDSFQVTASVFEQIAVEIGRPAAFCVGGGVGLQVADGEEKFPQLPVVEGRQGRASLFQLGEHRLHGREIGQIVILSLPSTHVKLHSETPDSRVPRHLFKRW